MSTMAERLWDVTRTLPEPLLAEVLDFAEFLQARRGVTAGDAPVLHLTALCGGLENSAAFNADPLTIQHQLRDEWHEVFAA